VVCAPQIVFVDSPLGAVRGGPLARAPPFGQPEAMRAMDPLDVGIEELLRRDLALLDVGPLATVESLYRARVWAGPREPPEQQVVVT
jgi:hypothetical protein